MADAKTNLEPWLRPTHRELPAVVRAVVHALELAQEDVLRWCEYLTNDEWNMQPFELASVAWQVRHLTRSVDRLLTYAEGGQLNPAQLEAAAQEGADTLEGHELLREFEATVEEAKQRLTALREVDLESVRRIGRKAMEVTLGGLLVHLAEHAARHTGQVIVAAKLAVRAKPQP